MAKKVIDYNQFDIEATIQSIWMEMDLEVKKRRMIDEVISQFKFKAKIPEFTRKVLECNSHTRIDAMLANIVLHGAGLSTLGI